MSHRLEFLYQHDVSHRAISVYLYLAERANEDGECWPALPTIAKELKLSEATVRRAIKDLKKIGAVVTMPRYRKNGGTSSLCYKLQPKKPP